MAKKKVETGNYYALDWTPAGPVFVLVLTGEEAANDPDLLQLANEINDLFTFEEAKSYIVEYYKKLAEDIDDMKEEELLAYEPSEVALEEWRKYLENGKESDTSASG